MSTSLVPLPRVHLTRFHGVFAPHSRLRAGVTPAGRGSRRHREGANQTPVPKHVAMTWMQRLKRVFHIDIETCPRCGGRLKVIASIEEPAAIRQILDHLQRLEQAAVAPLLPRAPPPLERPV